ncbi:TetR/AcrR family transcriptional regulator [Paenibacillus sp. NEAU-GSW1]|uniref:TetR/AcrR family transcriptional regulator n=1 Tax=Paenibacillus sp. NEAU-GSW1 TaxID=2682486 RepID=UPI0012E20309|nr:TetR/AcrR family transcriptional regulator [Paenibacillus sp. NEAU-GSW1]MUT68345.1 TetR family transcriptional regulator [Paenibacillus sp. NEAU-GSW1]
MKEDRRISRTKRMLHEALLGLILEKGFESVTVQDIIDRANIGRSTFYAHFYDKHALLQYGFSYLQEHLSEQQQPYLRRSQHPNEKPRFSFSLPMFQHAHEHHKLYQALVGKQSGVVVQLQMKELFASLVRAEMLTFCQQDISSPFPMEVVEQFVVHSFTGLLTWWLDQSMPYSAEEMDHMFQAVTLPGMMAVLYDCTDNASTS